MKVKGSLCTPVFAVLTVLIIIVTGVVLGQLHGGTPWALLSSAPHIDSAIAADSDIVVDYHVPPAQYGGSAGPNSSTASSSVTPGPSASPTLGAVEHNAWTLDPEDTLGGTSGWPDGGENDKLAGTPQNPVTEDSGLESNQPAFVATTPERGGYGGQGATAETTPFGSPSGEDESTSAEGGENATWSHPTVTKASPASQQTEATSTLSTWRGTSGEMGGTSEDIDELAFEPSAIEGSRFKGVHVGSATE
jgi:hypothetical protein